MEGLKVGDGASFSRTIAECDIYNFAGLTGDLAPQHLDEAMMRRSAFGKRIAHGAMMVGFMSRVSTMAVAGVVSTDGSETLVNQGYDRIRFVAPVFIGDTITVTYRVTELDAVKRRAKAEVRITNESGATVAIAVNILRWVTNTASTVVEKKQSVCLLHQP